MMFVGLVLATDVVVGGCSAGGMHVFDHIDAVRGLLPASARVAGYADSGFALTSPGMQPYGTANV